jgi:replicative DNA helicase
MIYDLAVRRDLIRLGQDISARARRVASDPKEQIVAAEQALYSPVRTGPNRKRLSIVFARRSPMR